MKKNQVKLKNIELVLGKLETILSAKNSPN